MPFHMRLAEQRQAIVNAISGPLKCYILVTNSASCNQQKQSQLRHAHLVATAVTPLEVPAVRFFEIYCVPQKKGGQMLL